MVSLGKKYKKGERNKEKKKKSTRSVSGSLYKVLRYLIMPQWKKEK